MKIIQDKVILDRIQSTIMIFKRMLYEIFLLMKDLYIMFNGHHHLKSLFCCQDLCLLVQLCMIKMVNHYLNLVKIIKIKLFGDKVDLL
jgi:hypothetical protein